MCYRSARERRGWFGSHCWRYSRPCCQSGPCGHFWNGQLWTRNIHREGVGGHKAPDWHRCYLQKWWKWVQQQNVYTSRKKLKGVLKRHAWMILNWLLFNSIVSYIDCMIATSHQMSTENSQTNSSRKITMWQPPVGEVSQWKQQTSINCSPTERFFFKADSNNWLNKILITDLSID